MPYKHQGYNPNRAGAEVLKLCADARKILIDRLPKPDRSDEAAYEAWMLEVKRIREMDHKELASALVQ